MPLCEVVTVWDANDYTARLRCWQRGCEAALCAAGTPDILVSGYADGKVLAAWSAEIFASVLHRIAEIP